MEGLEFKFRKSKQEQAFCEVEGSNFESPEELERFIFWSFMLSQGMPSAQAELFKYAREKYGNLDPGIYDEAVKLFAKKRFSPKNLELNDNLLKFHQQIEYDEKTRVDSEFTWMEADTSSAEKIARFQLNKMKLGSLEQSGSANLNFFAYATWRADREYYMKGGRQRGSYAQAGNDTIMDPWFSFGVKYLVRDGFTNVSIIDSFLYEASQASPLQPSPSKLTYERLDEVREIYDEYHPNSRLTAQEWNGYIGRVRLAEESRDFDEH